MGIQYVKQSKINTFKQGHIALCIVHKLGKDVSCTNTSIICIFISIFISIFIYIQLIF